MNEFDFVLTQYKYGATAVARKYRKQVFKNQEIEITPCQNGYLIEYSYRVLADAEAKDSFDKYEYVREKSIFKTWEEVVDFVSTNKLEVPPAKI